jgi:NADPH2:quinone reductase
MKAAYINQTGPPDCMEYGDLPQPEPTGREVLVRVKAAAVNPIDTYIRNGADYWELPKPFIVGCDLAGEVEAIGPDVTMFRPGDRVWGSNQGLLGRQGTFAQYCAVDECWLYPTPDSVDDQQAAACALVGITAHLGLFAEARLQSGESVFVRGGTGGVGSMVVQMAILAGARVLATGGSDEKVQRCLELGADAAVNYKTRDVPAAVAAFAPEGINLFWETLREPNFEETVSYLADRGRIILMAGRDACPRFPVGPFYVKCCSMHGFVMFKAAPEVQRQSAEQINQWLASGQLKANISHVLPLSEAAQAHQLQEDNTLSKAGTLAGKIVVVPD